jgi:hypothetical protein
MSNQACSVDELGKYPTKTPFYNSIFSNAKSKQLNIQDHLAMN